jgi:RHS repeat-associated protein
MIKKLLVKITSLTLLLLCLFGKANAQFQEGVELSPVVSNTQGTAVLTNAINSLESNITDPKQILNIITFKINESSATYFATSFTATINFNIEFTDFNGTITNTTNNTLTVNYDNTPGAKYKILDYKTYKNFKKVKITYNVPITFSQAPAGWNPLLVLEVNNEMRTTVYNNLSTVAADLVPILNPLPFLPTPDVLKVSWKFAPQAHENLTQLEWAFVEDEMISFYGGDFNAIFQNNSTRIDLEYSDRSKKIADNNNYVYNIPALLPLGGKLYYRMRAVQRKANGTLIAGAWSIISTSTTPPTGIASIPAHEPNLNWQSSTSFAEGGKSKTVIQYFDGSLRGRQIVTKDNTTGNTVVGETIYDMQGRPNIQILPTPTNDQEIKYFRNFNKFGSQQIIANTDGTFYNDDPAKYFDLTITAAKCQGADTLDRAFGNAKYYSSNNPWLTGPSAEAKSKYIPDAQGYAYTETRFMDDATERVEVQGGVGKDHQIGSGHETKYFYGKPTQEELDALFATEVGYADHYSKNMVQDANGQRSVSYVDMHGRTVATALAGDPTNGIDSIINAADYPLINPDSSIKYDLLTPTTNIIQGNSIVSVSTFLAASNTACSFVYDLTPPILQLNGCNNQTTCFDCKYDLEISIRSEACGTDSPIVRRYNNLQQVPANAVCNTPMGFVGPGYTTPTTQITFNTTLPAGSYVIRKTLTINDSMFRVRRDSAIKVLLCKTRDSIFNSIKDSIATLMGCGVTPTQQCDTCLANLGTFIQYKTKYLLTIAPATASTEEIYTQFLSDSTDCASMCSDLDTCATNVTTMASTLVGLRNQMLADMKPFTGQYALEEIPTYLLNGTTLPDPNSIDAKYNIFSNSYTGPFGTQLNQPIYKYPNHQTNSPSSVYYDESNQIDFTIHGIVPPSTTTILSTATKQDFAMLFQNSWANSLIKYHPEYSKLKFAEENLKRVYDWADNVNAVICYNRAVDSNFVNPLISDPYFLLPGTQQDKDTLQHYLFTGLSYNTTSPSIWKLANSAVLCATVDSVNKYACLMQRNSSGLEAGITTNADKDEVWDNFKTAYLSYRDEMVLRYIQNNTPGVIQRPEIDALLTADKDLVFANFQDANTQNGGGAGTIWGNLVNSGNAGSGFDTTGIGAYIAANGLDNCNGQKPYWKAKLKNCEILKTYLNSNTSDTALANNIINTILDGMVLVCQNSVNAQQPYGSSTLAPGTTATPTSFETVINSVFTANGIATPPANYFCNPYTIEFPKPYGLNPALYVNNSNVLDSCACRRFAEMQQEAAAATNPSYNPYNFASFNLFLIKNYKDSLTLVVWNGLQNCGNMFVDTCMALKNKTANLKINGTVKEIKLAQLSTKKVNISSKNVSSYNTKEAARLNTACPPPVISTVIFNTANQTLDVSFTLPRDCNECRILMYNSNNELIQEVGKICGTNIFSFGKIDPCEKYQFKIICNVEECGELVSPIYYYKGCCIAPIITSALFNTEDNAIQVSYTLPSNCENCFIYIYNQNINLVLTEGLECSSTLYNFKDAKECEKYHFKIICTSKKCDQLVSNTIHYLGCCPPPVITSAAVNAQQTGIEVQYTLPINCTNCWLDIFDEQNNLISTINGICGTTSYFLEGEKYDVCKKYNFKITCSSEKCDKLESNVFNYLGCCPPPVIISAVYNVDAIFISNPNEAQELDPEPGGIEVTFTLPPNCENCVITMYDEWYNVVGQSGSICGTNMYTFLNASECNKYNFIITCSSKKCDKLTTDTLHYLGCCPPPVITSAAVNAQQTGIEVQYTLPINCTNCWLDIFDEQNNLISTINGICGTTSYFLDGEKYDTCKKYNFKITCSSEKCDKLESNVFNYLGCCPPPVITAVAYDVFAQAINVFFNLPANLNCTNCKVLMMDVDGNVIREATDICNQSVYSFVDIDTCAKYNFQVVCYTEKCGNLYSNIIRYNGCIITPCVPPVITAVNATSGGFVISHTLPANCNTCTLTVFNEQNTVVYNNAGICGTNATYFATADTCAKYKFLISCEIPTCGILQSDTATNPICTSNPVDTCTIYNPIYLPTYAVIPAFLSCGYVKPCITCGKIDALTAEFTTIYPSYSGVPFLQNNNTQQQININNLWARFINYRVGFSKKAMDYAQAYRNCHPVDSTGTPTTPQPPTTNAICALEPPLNSPSSEVDSVGTSDGPCQQAATMAYYMADMQINSIRESLIAKFDSLYLAKCLSAQYAEQFYIKYKPKEYHFTLYYYDQAGNLVKTMPPAAVKPNYSSTYLANVKAARNADIDLANPSNNEALATNYRYNSLNQVIEQKTPDAGISKFWYDRLGRLVVSQNAIQQTTNKYSYTQYDDLGRITTVGEKPQTQLMSQAISQNETDLATWLADVGNGGQLKKQITRTVYDVGYFNANQPTLLQPVLTQTNLRNRVSYTQLINQEPTDFATNEFAYVGAHSAATYYSYDIHGNVDTLVQDFNEGYMKYKDLAGDPGDESNLSGSRFKKMVYDYDLISGKVNKVSYQPSMTDQFYHKYGYDAENRITKVEVSHDSIYWEKDASYEYYRHGPLNRTVLGQNQVQGLDYAYTIQGWLKGVNSTAIKNNAAANPTSNTSFDMGGDDLQNTPSGGRGADAFGFSLNYFSGDYKPIGLATPSFNQPFTSVTNNLTTASDGVQLGKDLFNGNIRAMLVNIPSLGVGGQPAALLYGYRYDQLNRIKAMNSFTGFNNNTNDFGTANTPTITENYKERVTYDPNGNIKTYLRNGTTIGGTPLQMDNFDYSYNTTAGQLQNNKLRHVKDAIAATNYTEDVDNQNDDNFKYDAIGNLVQDKAEGIYDPADPQKNMIEWTVYGKISSITKIKNGTTTIKYTYDASGNRISKYVLVTPQVVYPIDPTAQVPKPMVTYYVRDASGNVMSIYSLVAPAANTNAELTQTEVSLYGSSRLGVWNLNRSVANIEVVDYTAFNSNFTRGNKVFELSNHLGNVLVTVSDKRIAVDSDNDGIINYYSADVVTATDYYPFGMTMPGRKYTQPASSYRYGFNGQENSDEIAAGLTTAMYWEYDSRIGRRWNVDPKAEISESFYLCLGNNPIKYSDKNGDKKDGWIKDSEGNVSFDSRINSQSDANAFYGKGTTYISPNSAGSVFVDSKTGKNIQLIDAIPIIPGSYTENGVTKIYPDQAGNGRTAYGLNNWGQSNTSKMSSSDIKLNIVPHFMPKGYHGIMKNIIGIVLHRTQGSNEEGTFSSWKQNKLATHYLVARDGTIYNNAPENTLCWHVGKPKGNSGINNSNAIGIEVVGCPLDANGKETCDSKKFGGDNVPYGWSPLTPAQIISVANLTNNLIHRYNFNLSNLHNHEDVSKKSPKEGLTVRVAIDGLLNKN